MRATLPLLEVTDFPPIRRKSLETLQVNLGYKCNQRCLHCYVNAGPNRKEMMTRETLELILPVVKARQIKTLDLTGGAPELHADFRHLVAEARAAGVQVIDRSVRLRQDQLSGHVEPAHRPPWRCPCQRTDPVRRPGPVARWRGHTQAQASHRYDFPEAQPLSTVHMA